MIFRLKKFTILQEKSTFKVGTDAVLLGSSLPKTYKSALEIGSGTGIISLMLAQDSETNIVAIEPNALSYEECKLNFSSSPFSDRLKILQNKFENFNPSQTFDLIFSNPPFFHNDLRSDNKNKMSARHTLDFDLSQLISKLDDWLNPNGHICFILPYQNEFDSLFLDSDFNQISEMAIRSYSNSDPIRKIVMWGRNPVHKVKKMELVIYKELRSYSDQYINLLKNYLTIF